VAVRSKSVCRHPGCGTLVDASGFCNQHKRDSVGWFKTSEGSSHERGYGPKWRKVRAAILRRDNWLCQPCLRQGHNTHASEVDHIISKADGGVDDPLNLQAICAACHKAKTASERGGAVKKSAPDRR